MKKQKKRKENPATRFLASPLRRYLNAVTRFTNNPRNARGKISEHSPRQMEAIVCILSFAKSIFTVV